MALFLAMTAGSAPTPWLLPIATTLARFGPWFSAAVMLVAAIRRRDERGYLLALLCMAALGSLVAHALASSLGYPRPFMLGLTPSHLAHGGSDGLPSTHATVMGLVAFGMLVRRPLRRYGVAAMVLALATGWARIHVGVHFPLDVVAGLGLAAAMLSGFLVLQWQLRIRLGANPPQPSAPAPSSAIAPSHREKPLP
ncbi:phosphatase PAP2 family protein [uncultured Pseudacidovorax sp.]|uniref:phosphatase PAP2 family protein n=1 Tax=uncultured Pseudacidovorax sp. TaxID=679313 RepID=UPI0025EF8B29|nr:phosphatase PAP2 family protein [uncultured Pseudacidovorax sp.]